MQENAFENVVCEMASISSRPQWVKHGSVYQVTGRDIDLNNTLKLAC